MVEYSTREKTLQNRLRVYFVFSALLSTLLMSGCMTTDGISIQAHLSNYELHLRMNISIDTKVEKNED